MGKTLQSLTGADKIGNVGQTLKTMLALMHYVKQLAENRRAKIGLINGRFISFNLFLQYILGKIPLIAREDSVFQARYF